jgi:hypothetical protein
MKCILCEVNLGDDDKLSHHLLVEHDMVSEQRAVDCILVLQKRIEELKRIARQHHG